MPPSTPAASAATSTFTFSVSSCTSVSPASTCSPSRLSHAPTVASTTDSPSAGTRTSVGMARDSLESFRNDALLFGAMGLAPALGWTGPLGPSDVADALVSRERLQPWHDERPRAHVAGFLLQPDDLSGFAVAPQRVGELVSGKWVQLLESHYGHALCSGATAIIGLQVGPDVAVAQHDAVHAGRMFARTGVVEDRLEAALDEVHRARGSQWMAEQALRRHHDQWPWVVAEAGRLSP